MTSMEYADGTGVMLSFDPLRKLQEIKDSTGTTKIENDEYGRILSVTDGTGKTVGYEWGSMNERLATIYPDGRKAVMLYVPALKSYYK